MHFVIVNTAADALIVHVKTVPRYNISAFRAVGTDQPADLIPIIVVDVNLHSSGFIDLKFNAGLFIERIRVVAF